MVPVEDAFCTAAFNSSLCVKFPGVRTLLCVFRRPLMPLFHELSTFYPNVNEALLSLSRLFARYLKRGVSDTGKVANDVEVEQVIFFLSTSHLEVTRRRCRS